jgi:hypothetical protein
MTVEQSLSKFISSLKKDPGYKNWKDHFENWVQTKDRVNDELKCYLLYDIDHRSYKIRSEYSAPHNTIKLITALIPPKRDKNKLIQFQYHNYKVAEKE